MLQSENSNQPPIVEVVISILFPDISQDAVSGIAVSAGFWINLRDRFPCVKAAPPIQIDQQSLDLASMEHRQLKIALFESPTNLRFQMQDSDKQYFCQIQNDRFTVNYRRNNTDYSRFESIKKTTLDLWAEWISYAEQLGCKVEPAQWQVKYLNAYFEGSDWDNLKNIGQLIPGIAPRNQIDGFDLMRIATEQVWYSQDLNCRVDLSLKPHRGDKGKGVLFELTAHGKCSDDDLSASIEVGHKLLNDVFEQCGK